MDEIPEIKINGKLDVIVGSNRHVDFYENIVDKPSSSNTCNELILHKNSTPPDDKLVKV